MIHIWMASLFGRERHLGYLGSEAGKTSQAGLMGDWTGPPTCTPLLPPPNSPPNRKRNRCGRNSQVRACDKPALISRARPPPPGPISAYTYTYTHIHTYTHTHIHAYTHTRIISCSTFKRAQPHPSTQQLNNPTTQHQQSTLPHYHTTTLHHTTSCHAYAF